MGAVCPVCHVVQEDMHWRGRGGWMGLIESGGQASGDDAVSSLLPKNQVIGSESPTIHARDR